MLLALLARGLLLALLLLAVGILLGLDLLPLAVVVGLLGLVLGKALDHVLDDLAVAIQVVDRDLDNEVLVLGHQVGNDGSRASGIVPLTL